MSKTRFPLTLAALLGPLAACAAAPGLPAAPAAQTFSTARPLDCMIQPHLVVQIGSGVAGLIESIAVDRGDRVVRGQPIVHLAAQVERAALAVARERAGQQGEVAVASSSRELAERELERARELHARNFVSQTYLDKARAEAKVASGRSDSAQERRTLSTREVDLAAAQLGQRTIRSPIDGVVIERFMAPGEFVDQKPVLRIAAIDPLRVDVLVPAQAFGQVSAGQRATVVPELLNRSEHMATVRTVDKVVDAATNTFRVRLELPNPGAALPAGLRCKVDLALRLPDAAPVASASLPALRESALKPTGLQP